MKIGVALGVFVFLCNTVIITNGNSFHEVTVERHSRVRYLPGNLHQNLTYPPLKNVSKATNTSINTTNLKTKNNNYKIKRNQTKKQRKVKRPKMNVTEIIGYLNSNPSQNVKIVKPELNEYLNTLGHIKVNKTLKDNQENVISNLNTLLVNVKNFSCDINNGGCSQFCNDAIDFKCTCLKGFALGKDGKTCFDVNECLRKNGGCSHRCVNTHGFYHCACPRGLRLGDDFKTCKDINECVLRNGHGPCQDVCKNTFGSYECSCSIKGSRLSLDKHTCEDINECSQGTSGCSHGCINIIGGAVCTCPYRMTLKDDLKTCYDPEEQSDDINTCPLILSPRHGYFRCKRKKPFEYFDIKNDDLIVNRIGETCTLVCRAGYKTIGDYRVTCGVDGNWLGIRTGKCLPLSDTKFNPRNNFIEVIWAYAKPKITCSPPMFLHVLKDQKFVRVRLKPPRTNVNWKNVRSFPPYVKESMEIYLPPGHHSVVFQATDSVAKLSSKCIISIIVKRENER
ncbi:hypothetical protein RN001_010153 [Aquatica leii]|uniref:Sushi domain-containing protein n=1 Tax=Aquatica leii TaxID=1421715 RepID=A0AAN7P661_9COLE|nr:hypothetical protein RN001_010153 [Aquatica leii]